MLVGAGCAQGDLSVQVAAGHPRLTGDPERDALWCAEVLATLAQYREAYEERFGHQPLARQHQADRGEFEGGAVVEHSRCRLGSRAPALPDGGKVNQFYVLAT